MPATGTAGRRRIENALWGLFIGDALAMPVHWYYDPANIEADFPGGVRGYEAARHPHPEAFMLGRPYRPDVASAQALGRPYDILHGHARFYTTTYTEFAIARTERDRETGNAIAGLSERYHYHHGLRAGENTVAAHLVRVLLRTVVAAGRYEPDAFLDGFIAHLATPGRNRDAYLEAWIRYWFENYARGLPAHACAARQRDDWSIAAHSALARPLVLALLASNGFAALGLALEHHALTHRSETNNAAIALLVPVLRALTEESDPAATLLGLAANLHLPAITGTELFARYAAAGGPYNIPKDEMWRLHAAFRPEPLDLGALVERGDDAAVIRALVSTACYPEHGVPLLLYLALRHGLDLEAALLANANAGGDNVHRGAVLGLLLGAATDSVPERLKRGLLAHDELAVEIAAFAALAGTAAAS
ncbi:MAG: ADP-ribosylglycohydrolase family protein [Geminicoccaceae bacterium]